MREPGISLNFIGDYWNSKNYYNSTIQYYKNMYNIHKEYN